MDIVDAIPETHHNVPPRTHNPLDRAIGLYREPLRTEYPLAEIRLHGVSTHIGLERAGNTVQQVFA